MSRLILLPVCLLLLLSCKDDQPALDEKLVQATLRMDTVAPIAPNPNIGRILNGDTLFKYFDTVEINGQVFFFTEGDLLLPEAAFTNRLLQEYLEEGLETIQQPIHKRFQEVIILYDEQKKDTIKWNTFPIRFCISKSSFDAQPGGYQQVQGHLLRAMEDWSKLCRVSFQYVPEADTKENMAPYRLDFVVRYLVPQKATANVATAFFPNDPPHLRVLNILPAYWSTRYDKTGVLRHELGHIFGFRHEHASKISLVPLDCRQRFAELELPSRPVTTYDSFSVMHYFCGGAGTRAMSFSARDSIGFTAVYGKNQNQ